MFPISFSSIKSKIGVHFIDGHDKGEGFTRTARPSVVVLVNAFAEAEKIVSLPHRPLVIGRVSRADAVPEDWIEQMTPELAFDRFRIVLEPQVVNNPSIRHWIITNEPVVDTPSRMDWLDRFNAIGANWLALKNRTLVACNFSVGTPIRSLWKHLPRTLSLTRSTETILGLHRYIELIRTESGIPDLNATVDGFWGRYTELNDIPDLAALGFYPKIAITEGGLEFIGKGKAWRAENIPPTFYSRILHERDLRLQKISQILGEAIFTCGGRGWESHDIANSPMLDLMSSWAQILEPQQPLFSYPWPGGVLRSFSWPSTLLTGQLRSFGPRQIDVFERLPHSSGTGEWWRLTREGRLWIQSGI